MHRPRRPPPAGGAKLPAPGRRACRGIGCRRLAPGTCAWLRPVQRAWMSWRCSSPLTGSWSTEPEFSDL